MELSSQQMQNHRFPSAVRGYSKDAVDAFLKHVTNRCSMLEEQLQSSQTSIMESEESLAKMQKRIDSLVADATSPATTATAEAILLEAEATAALQFADMVELRKTATDEAALILQHATEDAAVIRSEVARVEEAARVSAARTREAAEAMRVSLETQLIEIDRLLRIAQSRKLITDLPSEEDQLVDLRDTADAQITVT